MASKTRPKISDRMTLGNGLEAFTANTDDPTWTESHHKRTFWLSDEVWEALGERADSDDRSKTSLAEEALRNLLGLPPHE